MEQPRECCGLLIGTPTRILEAVPVGNAAADPMRRYEIPPVDYAAQIRRCRDRTGVAVVGAYHSHPRTAPVPSPTDTAEAFPHFWFLIAGPVAGDAPVYVRAYHLVDGNLLEVMLVTDAEEQET
jgi:proteasome lid subunit RPN8/RPN11